MHPLENISTVWLFGAAVLRLHSYTPGRPCHRGQATLLVEIENALLLWASTFSVGKVCYIEEKQDQENIPLQFFFGMARTPLNET